MPREECSASMVHSFRTISEQKAVCLSQCPLCLCGVALVERSLTTETQRTQRSRTATKRPSGSRLCRILAESLWLSVELLLFEALPPRGIAADSLRCARKGKAFPQGQRQSRTDQKSCSKTGSCRFVTQRRHGERARRIDTGTASTQLGGTPRAVALLSFQQTRHNQLTRNCLQIAVLHPLFTTLD